MQVDVIDFCALLECVGLQIKSVDSIDPPSEQDSAGGNTVTIVCKHSGLRVILDSTSTVCTCPAIKDDNSSGFWQVSGVSHGVVENNKETGSTLLGSLPDKTKKIVTRELHKIVQFSRTHANEDYFTNPRHSLKRCTLFDDVQINNRTSSLTDLNLSPSNEGSVPNVDPMTKYRSLDTLTTFKKGDEILPAPGILVAKIPAMSDTSDIIEELPETKVKQRSMLLRQETYTRTPVKNNIMMRSKTSSPMGKLSESMLHDLKNVENTAEKLRDMLSNLLNQISTDKPEDCSVVSLNLDVSKIPEPQSKSRCISSPNLSAFKRNEISTSTKKTDSNSTSRLTLRQKTPSSIKPPSRLQKLSPGIFRKKDDSASKLTNGNGVYRKLSDKQDDKRQSKIGAPARSRISMGLSANRTPTNTKIPEGTTTSLSTTKKQYSHVKSTIPKPTSAVKKL